MLISELVPIFTYSQINLLHPMIDSNALHVSSTKVKSLVGEMFPKFTSPSLVNICETIFGMTALEDCLGPYIERPYYCDW